MPSYQNFRESYRRRAETDNVFYNPKITVAKEIDASRRVRLIDWITFYRRNIHRFVQHYFGIKLFPYQILWIYLMGISDSFVAICSRAASKTWLLAVFACAKAVLYPNSEIVVVASTKAQAGIIVSDKITTLRNDFPNVAREIADIVPNLNKLEVIFHNGSSIRVVASRDSARGKRATFIIYEEFRLIEKEVLDAVIRPTAYARQTPYLHNPEFESMSQEELSKLGILEEPKEVFISSAYHKGLWWFDETKKTIRAMLNGDNSYFIAFDYLISLKHKIKTIRQLKNEMSKMDDVSVLEEYLNIPYGESSSAYFKLNMFLPARKLEKAFYPQRMDEYNPKKNPYDVPRQDGELRILGCDIAQRGGKTNDLSINACLRLLPSRKGYIRELVYMESKSGVNSIIQALDIKRLYHDFNADAIVLDVTTIGINVLDELGQLTHDTERGIEYPPLMVMFHESLDKDKYEELKKRTISLNAKPVIYPISATAKLNSDIAVDFRDKLKRKMIRLLVDENAAEEYLIKTFGDRMNEDSDIWAFYRHPYFQTNFFIGECINLSMVLQIGNVKLVEMPGNRKDRYSAVSYASYYVSFLDKGLIREDESEDDFEYLLGLVRTT